MNHSIRIKEKLLSLIREMDHYHWLFTRNPEKDFSRIKKWSFGEVMRFIICLSPPSLSGLVLMLNSLVLKTATFTLKQQSTTANRSL